MDLIRDFSRHPPSVMTYLHGDYVPAWPVWKERTTDTTSWRSTRIDGRVYLAIAQFDIMRGSWNMRLHRHRPDLPHTARSVPWELIWDRDFALAESCAQAFDDWSGQPSTTAITGLPPIRLCHQLP